MGIGAPINFFNTATRHALDINATFGISSDRFNARDKYRREYDGTERAAAGAGVALGTALPATGLVAWARRGAPVPLATGALSSGAGKAAGMAALGLATAVGAHKMYQIVEDDGHVGALGLATGVVAGTVGGLKLGGKFAGKYAPIVSAVGMVAGGVGGYQAGKLVRVGEGHIGEAHVKAPQVDANAKDRVGSFARGAFTHFNEVGPASQGVSLGYAWGMQDAVATKYSPSERAGAMHGDLGAAALLGGGALGVLAAVKMAGKNSGGAAGLASTKVGAAATAAGKVLAQGRMMGAIQKIAPMGVAGMGAAAVGIAGLTAMKEMDQARNAGVSGTGVAAIGAGVIGATAATAAMVSRSSALAGKPMAPAAAASALTAAALIGVLSSARLPLQQFMNDSKTAHAVRGETDWAVSGPMLGIGGLAGGVGALKTAQKLVPDSGFSLGKFRIPKAAIVGVATAAGAGGLGAVGYGLSATMPDVKTVGLTAAAGAAIGAGAGVALKGLGPRNGAIAGAVLGASTSSLVKQPS